MKKTYLILTVALLLGACKKHHDQPADSSNVPPYFQDIIINEVLPNGSTSAFNHALGYFALGSDPATQIMVASRGREEHYDARGFRIASIKKADGTVNWVKSFDLSDDYTIQIATCADMDKNENIWVGGHCFYQNQLGTMFLVKLDRNGNLLWSKTFPNAYYRAYSLVALANGDVALLGKNAAGLVVHRVTTDGNPVWSTTVGYTNGGIDDDYYSSALPISPENHGMVAASDGSIYAATSSNPGGNGVGGRDRVYRWDGNGNLSFANVYSLDGNLSPVKPVQLVAAGPGKFLLADQITLGYGYGDYPYFMLLAADGSVTAARGRPNDGTNPQGITMNQVNFYHDSVYYSTCGDKQFNTYVLDANLNLLNAVKTASAIDIGTDRGGISLWDEGDRSLYYVLNFGGNPGESNGFEVLRNGVLGKPCINTYTVPPGTLLLQNATVHVAKDADISSSGIAPMVTLSPLSWRSYIVASHVEVVCGH